MNYLQIAKCFFFFFILILIVILINCSKNCKIKVADGKSLTKTFQKAVNENVRKIKTVFNKLKSIFKTINILIYINFEFIRLWAFSLKTFHKISTKNFILLLLYIYILKLEALKVIFSWLIVNDFSQIEQI